MHQPSNSEDEAQSSRHPADASGDGSEQDLEDRGTRVRTLSGSPVLARVSLVSHPFLNGPDGSVQRVSASLRLSVLTLSSLQLLLQLLRGSEDGEHGRMT